MDKSTAIVLGGVAIVGLILYYKYKQQQAAQAAINSNPITQAKQAVVNAGSQLLTTGVTAADGIVAGVGNQLANIFGNQNSSGICMPTETTGMGYTNGSTS